MSFIGVSVCLGMLIGVAMYHVMFKTDYPEEFLSEDEMKVIDKFRSKPEALMFVLFITFSMMLWPLLVVGLIQAIVLKAK